MCNLSAFPYELRCIAKCSKALCNDYRFVGHFG